MITLRQATREDGEALAAIYKHYVENTAITFEYVAPTGEEFADRIVAPAGSADYGAVTAAVQYFGSPKKLFKVAAGNFLPAPKVDSAVLRIDLYEDRPVKPQNEAQFRRIIRLAFEQRRKTLVNALAGGIPLSKEAMADILVSLSLPADVRGEKLSVQQFALISDRITDALEKDRQFK